MGFISILLSILVAGAVSRRIQGTIISLAMVYTVLGLLIGEWGLGFVTMDLNSEIIRIITELTLVLLLASDAARINVRMLIRDHTLPQRLLGIGLPLTMLLGTLLAYVIFGELGLWGAVVLAILLAPTDAGLGQPVVTNPRVPVRIRQTLNIESGLNDGIAMPFLILALSLAVGAEENQSVNLFVVGALIDIGIAVLVGIVMGWLGSRFLLWGLRSGWMLQGFRKLGGIAIILLTYAVAELVGGNGFIAAFVVGMVMGDMMRDAEEDVNEHVEVEVSLLTLLTFVLYGAILLPNVADGMNGKVILYAILSLTLIRILPVAISLIGAKVHPITTLFIGWFGPRGLASILYIFTVIETEELHGVNLIFDVAMVTILFSIFLHGISASPAARFYGDFIAKHQTQQPDAAEHRAVSEMPVRSPEVGRSF
ncbi:MAG: cation:proton antiporter [Caldilineales bacterium]|nr:cation:proton antiporter [Caldilineales bacterium]